MSGLLGWYAGSYAQQRGTWRSDLKHKKCYRRRRFIS